MQREKEFECEIQAHSNSDKCIFHDKNFLHNEKNRKKIQEEFRKKVDESISNNHDAPLFCIGYCLHDIDILDLEFHNSVYFEEAIISGYFYTNSKFRNHISFTRAQFSGRGDISFRNAHFSGGNVSFSNARFSEVNSVYFDGAQFSGPFGVFFNRTQFIDVVGNISFRNTQFLVKRNVSFSEARFSGGADISFREARFSGEGDVFFDSASFFNKGTVDFRKAKFSNERHLNFEGAKFCNQDSVYFTDTVFSNNGNVSFIDAEFTNKHHVNFTDAKFCNQYSVDFGHTKFSNEDALYFTETKFSNGGNVEFRHTKFFNEGNVHFGDAELSNKGNVDFYRAAFSNNGNVNFKGTKFCNAETVDFYLVEFSGDVVFETTEFKSVTLFRNVKFGSPEEIRFKTEDLSNVSFVNTDITRIFFDENTRFGKLDERFKIFDETRFEESIDKNDFKTDETRFEESIDKRDVKTISELKQKELSLGRILTTYRNLRENYEYRLRYEEAGQFFVREMELKRNYRQKFLTKEETDIPKRNNWFRRNLFSFIGLYRNICNYGESSTRPLILFFIITILSSTYWYVSSTIGLPLQKDILLSSCNEHPVFCSLERTLNDIVGFPEKGLIIDYITRISSIIVLATLFLPFRRKFERRFRH